ncbi:CoA transferase [Pseudarthrobacter sp. NamE2]|uniref:CoA transferase n=1 Tax=Pseudarthrobacter sp. NamE2 TaxID=2576838 RepID=UPI0010FE6854|nr:CoA transferase [Pseudarthrobacter sp. NamE2]TLM80643.1 CoA transferase [Pseudarthrobacter sp. NamE2]
MGSRSDDDGPRRWWAGPLDVEGLALGSVRTAAAALELYTGLPGSFTTSSAMTAAAFDSSGQLRIAGRKLQGFAPLSGFRPTRDGWIRLHANYPHHERRLLQALNARSPDQVEPALRTMTSLEGEAAIQARGGIAAAVRTRDQWLASDMGAAAREGPWIALTPAGGKEMGIGLDGQGIPDPEAPLPGAAENIRRPLAGVRVLDLTRVIAGPVATRLLAALGADVLRIDPPQLPELPDQFVDTCFGKRSAEADLGMPDNQRRLQELLKTADVVVIGYRHGSLDRFALGADALQAFRPGLAVVTLNSWGAAGPWRGLRGFDSIVQAAAGIAHAYGRERDDGGWQPGALPVQALDHATGYGAAAAAITLLAARRRTGRAGAGRLSLARTAEELCALPAVRTEPRTLPAPAYRSMPSTFGGLRYVPPPLAAAGQPLDYSGPPPPYGSSGLAWS